MTAKKKTARSKGGRPTKYEQSFARLAFNLALLGATNPELAAALDVAPSTIDLWLATNPEFSGAVKKGREEADARVSQALYHRAIGYSHKAVKILTVSDGNKHGSHVEEVPYTEHYPPDSTAMIFWLKNRQPDRWRDKQHVEHDVTDRLADAMREAEERLAHRD